jgi:predicted helicase
VCFVSNNSFVDQIAFDGMRKHVLQDFNRVYHLHLEGNVRHNPTLAGTVYNVFGIQVGVGITVAVRASRQRGHRLLFQRVDKTLRKEQKRAWLADHGSVGGVKWQRLRPDDRHTWLVPVNGGEFSLLPPLAAKAGAEAASGIFGRFSGGVKTNRDVVVYDFARAQLRDRVGAFIEAYNVEVDRYRRSGAKINVDDFVSYESLKWSRDLKQDLQRGRYAEFSEAKIRRCLYRPFCKRHLFLDRILDEEVYQIPRVFPTPESEGENRAIAVTNIGSEKPFMVLVSDTILDLHLVGAGAGSQCFPFYFYDEDGTNRRENITDWALNHFRDHFGDKNITKWGIFYYVYGLLHHPGYRQRYADNLKRELPRISLAPDFRAFATAGEKLARLHLEYETLEPWPLAWIESPGVPLSYRVERMRLAKDKLALVVNDSLTLGGIPPLVFEYRLGNRSALDWVVDQYQVSEDKRSGICSDPNRANDPEYVVRLVGQVVRVSVDTVEIVNGLPAEFGGGG